MRKPGIAAKQFKRDNSPDPQPSKTRGGATAGAAASKDVDIKEPDRHESRKTSCARIPPDDRRAAVFALPAFAEDVPPPSSEIASTAGNQPMPDILLIMPDQMRGDAMSAVGHLIVRTPTIDKLASEGVLFRRGYSSVPSCIPARYALHRTVPTEKRRRRVRLAKN